MRVALMHNPTAGDQDHSREGLTRTLEAAGHDVWWQATTDEGWERALNSPIDLVAVAGGDGTVRQVFKRVAGMGIPVTVLPVGSANNIATALGFEGDLAQLIRGWELAGRTPYDIGVFSTERQSDRFVESVGGGIFAELLARAEQCVDSTSGEEDVERGLRLLREVVASAPALPWDVEADGDDLSAELLAVEVMNVPLTGPNVPLALEADPGAGLLDLVVVETAQREALLSYLENRLEHGAARPPELPVRRCRRVVLGVPADSPMRLDDELLRQRGDCSASTTVTLMLGPQLEVIVPAA